MTQRINYHDIPVHNWFPERFTVENLTLTDKPIELRNGTTFQALWDSDQLSHYGKYPISNLDGCASHLNSGKGI
jgi:hypothetical protein